MGTGVKVSRVEPACPKAAPLGPPWKSKTKQRMVFGMIHVKDSLLLMGKVWSLDFLGPYVPAIHLSALLLRSIFPQYICICESHVFLGLPIFARPVVHARARFNQRLSGRLAM